MTNDAKGQLVFLGGPAARTPELARWLAEQATSCALVPLAVAYGQPEAAVVEAGGWLAEAGIEVEALMALTRTEADDAALAARLRGRQMAMILDGTPLHLRTALRSTALLEAMASLLARGGVVVAEGSSAGVLCDPMMDPRGGSLTVGLGLRHDVVVVAASASDSATMFEHKLMRTVELAPSGTTIVALEDDAVLVSSSEGELSRIGNGAVRSFRGGVELGLDDV